MHSSGDDDDVYDKRHSDSGKKAGDAAGVPAQGQPAAAGRNDEPRAEYILTDKGKDLGVVIGSLATWGSRHIYTEAALVHADCGQPVRMGYYCPHCDDRVRGASVKLQKKRG